MTEKEIETRIIKIETRNKRVSADKAWESSKIRRVIIFCFAYLFVGLYLTWLKDDNPWLSALVPPVVFLLSTLALKKVERIWIKKYLK